MGTERETRIIEESLLENRFQNPQESYGHPAGKLFEVRCYENIEMENAL